MEAPALTARDLCRGVLRLLADMGYASIPEFPLPNGRRADVFAIDARGRCLIVEIKSSPADFRADAKWRDYLGYGDSFYFAVAAGFPRDMLPTDTGLIIADGYGAAVARRSAEQPLAAARRRALLIDAARTAATRLQQAADPQAGNPGSLL